MRGRSWRGEEKEVVLCEDIVVIVGNVISGDADVRHGNIGVPSMCFHSEPCVGGHR